jgi:hypothetical protein
VDCEHLLQAHQHEKRVQPEADAIPNQDIEVNESFLRENEWVFATLLEAIADVARKHREVNDFDAREALDGLIRTYRTLESGLYYESRPVNPRAGGIFAAVQASVAEIRRSEAKARGMATLRDATVLRILVFIERVERVHNNGRVRSKAFLASVAQSEPEGAGSEEETEPIAPRLIL